MGKSSNVLLIAAATALIVFGVAAQTGTISLDRPAARPHGGVAGRQAVAEPRAPSPSSLPTPSPTPAQPAAAASAASGGGGDGEGDGGD